MIMWVPVAADKACTYCLSILKNKTLGGVECATLDSEPTAYWGLYAPFGFSKPVYTAGTPGKPMG